ncbi:MAG: TcpQ domain-containing protein [Betaproteobacteria bacterium]|uniref:TcpQ domain-containing protein n=1 Tax=Acidiphilium multivorum TaxID=62140 RepID=UPI001F4BE79D|nr:TcpQ domain-containing protein [Acidiphilium multivorum]MDE2343655.1 TcpQ domain-containing protein [Betaproteobacteria bacterium]UNC16189.1 hypothetical protein FE249_18205 [Acidiphilium multivorum]
MPRPFATFLLTSTAVLSLGTTLAQASVFGFGNDEPLTVAVKAIIPHSERVSYDGSVNRNTRVSWHGGASWRAVLESALHPAHLEFVDAGGKLHIFSIATGHRGAGDHSTAATAPVRAYPVHAMASPRETSAVVSPGLSIASMELPSPRPPISASVAIQPGGAISTSGLEIMAAQAPVKTTVDHLPSPVKVASLGRANTRAPIRLPLSGSPAATAAAADIKPTAQRLPLPPAAPVARVVPVHVEQTWILKRGSSLKTDLEQWGDRAGYQLYWEVQDGSGHGQTLIIPQTIRITGSFQQAVDTVARAMHASHVDFHVHYNVFPGANSATISGIWPGDQ